MSDSDKDFVNKVSLVINGNDIELNKFTDDIIKETILGLLKAIKTSEYGVDEVKTVEISIDNE
jgi:molybdopterin-guanine dinucleotide biosynthesis protein B